MDAKQRQEMEKDGLIVNMQGKPYITIEGLKFLMDERWGKENYSLQTHLPTTEENQKIREMMGLGPDMAYVVVRGEAWVKGIEKPFVNYGTGHKGNLTGFVKVDNAIEMACTRAICRAMRLATGASMAAAEEMPGGYSPGQQQQRPQQGQQQGPQNPDNRPPQQQYPPAAQQQTQSGEDVPLASDKQRNLMHHLAKDKMLSKEGQNFLAENANKVGLTKSLASSYISRAKAAIEKAKAAVDGDTGGEAMATDAQLATLSGLAYDSNNDLSDDQRADLSKTLRANDQAKDMTEAAAQSLIDEFTKAAMGLADKAASGS